MTQHKSSRDAVTRPRLADHNAKIDSPPAKKGGGAPKGASNQFRAAPTNVTACRCPGAEARHADKCTQSAHLSAFRGALAFRRYAAALARTFTSWRSSRPCLLGSVRADILPALSGSQSSGSTPRLGRSTEENDAQSRSGAGCEPARKHRTRSTLQIASGMRPSMSEISSNVTENKRYLSRPLGAAMRPFWSRPCPFYDERSSLDSLRPSA